VNKLIVVYWRDIPSQVRGRKGRKTACKQQLHERFQKAIDRAAMRAGRGSSDDYIADWRRESRPCDGELERAVSDEVSQLESAFPPDFLEKVIRAGGTLPKASE
jgi:hypothetical protein